MKRTLLIVLIALVGTMVFADGMASGSYPGDLLGRWRWESVKLLADTVETGDVSGKYTIRLNDGGTAEFRIDCRQGEGTWTADGTMLSINVTSLTDTSCGDEALNEAFLQLINEVGSFKYSFESNNDLILEFAAGTGRAVFLRAND